MAVKTTEGKPLMPAKLAQVKKGLASLASLKDYGPQRREFGPDNLAIVSSNLQSTYNAENDAKDVWDKAHSDSVTAQWAAWNFYQGAAESVIGQYGADSNEYASLGYKKKSEYKKTNPGRKVVKEAAAPKTPNS